MLTLKEKEKKERKKNNIIKIHRSNLARPQKTSSISLLLLPLPRNRLTRTMFIKCLHQWVLNAQDKPLQDGSINVNRCMHRTWGRLKVGLGRWQNIHRNAIDLGEN